MASRKKSDTPAVQPADVHDAVMDLPQEQLAEVVPFPSDETVEEPEVVMFDVDHPVFNGGPVDTRFPNPNRADNW